MPLVKWDLCSPTEASLYFFNRGHGCMRRSLVGHKCYLICSNTLSRCVWYMQLWSCLDLNERLPLPFSSSSCLTPVVSTAATPGTREVTHKEQIPSPKVWDLHSTGRRQGRSCSIVLQQTLLPLLPAFLLQQRSLLFLIISNKNYVTSNPTTSVLPHIHLLFPVTPPLMHSNGAREQDMEDRGNTQPIRKRQTYFCIQF